MTRLMGWTSNLQEPKRTNRYELLLDDDLRLTCRSVTMPNITVDAVDIHRMHNKYKVAGAKINYSDITTVFYDFIDNKAGKKLDEWHKQVYNRDTSLMGMPAEYKRNITLLMYGPDHSVVESWLLIGAWPKEITRPGLDWTTNGTPIEVTMLLSVDEVKQILS